MKINLIHDNATTVFSSADYDKALGEFIKIFREVDRRDPISSCLMMLTVDHNGHADLMEGFLYYQGEWHKIE